MGEKRVSARAYQHQLQIINFNFKNQVKEKENDVSSANCQLILRVCGPINFNFNESSTIPFHPVSIKWHTLTREEQSRYYEMARQQRQLHMQLYPNWTMRDSVASGAARKRRNKRDKAADGGRNTAPFQHTVTIPTARWHLKKKNDSNSTSLPRSPLDG